MVILLTKLYKKTNEKRALKEDPMTKKGNREVKSFDLGHRLKEEVPNDDVDTTVILKTRRTQLKICLKMVIKIVPKEEGFHIANETTKNYLMRL